MYKWLVVFVLFITVSAINAERADLPFAVDPLVVEPTSAIDEVETTLPPQETTIPLESREKTEEELQAEMREVERLQALERAQQQRTAEAQVATIGDADGSTCLRDRGNLRSHQQRIFNLTSPQGSSLIELLKKQDDLKARIATYQTLFDIWKQYQNFLNENDQLVNAQVPQGAKAALKSLNDLEGFLDRNQAPVERYHVVSEVLLSLPNRDELRNIRGDQEKLNYIKRKIQERCADSANSHLYICGINPETDINLEAQITRNPNNRAEFVNKFVNTLVKLDQPEIISAITDDFSSLFVDDPQHTNLTGDVQFAGTLKTMIQKAKNHCRENILLGDSNDVNCLSAPLNQAMGNGLSAAETSVIERLQTLHPEGGAINNVADLSSSYLEMAKKTKDFHEEATGGTINRIGQLTQNINQLRQNFESAEAVLTSPGTMTSLRESFKDLTAQKILNLGRVLNHGEFRSNQELYKNYLEGHENLLSAPGRLNLSRDGGENQAQFANRLVRDILCQNQSSGASCPINQDIFSQSGEDISLNQDNIIDLFNRLTSTTGGIDQLRNILGEEQEQGLKDEFERVQAEIAAIKNGRDYQELTSFKDFIWNQVRTSCLSGSENEVLHHTGSSCLIAPGVETGLNDFLQVGSELLSFSERNENKNTIFNLNDSCVRIHAEDRERYDREYSLTGICPRIFEERQREERQNIERAEAARRGPSSRRHDPNIIYEYDSQGRVVDRHVPNSNLAIFLPQLAYTVNEQLPFYFVQRPGMNMAIESWRQQGFQQKTYQAYMDSVNQSIMNRTVCGDFGCYFNSPMLQTASPTFGNSGFNFSSTTTTPFAF